MSKIVISTVGTLGDFLPFLALGKALQARGHEVVLAVNPAFLPLAGQEGLSALPCGPAFGPDEVRRVPHVPEGVASSPCEIKKWEAVFRDVPGRYRDLLAACAGADVLVAHSYHYAALLVRDRLLLPWVCVALSPTQFAHGDTLPVAQPAPRADLNLLASSRAFSSPLIVLHAGLEVTGFWYEAAGKERWPPTPALRAFLEEGERPLVLCLGGTPGPDAGDLVRLLAHAAAQCRIPLVVQTGWADLGAPANLPGRVHRTDFVDHDWLFSRAAAVVHPGGIGATAQALRAGLPMLLLPSRKDQAFHALLLRQLGVGFAAHAPKLTVEGAARLLAERLGAADTKQRARECAKTFGTEDGLGTACDRIEGLLRERGGRA
jgi:UDP:flavonoid glycosyltransferase YjiC (YdhE family)